MTTPESHAPIRTSRGQFAPGHSGNPAGRPRTEGAQVRARLQEHDQDVAAVVLERALAGDMYACRLILDRCVPPLKARAEPVHVAIPEGATIVQTAQAVLAAAAAGQLPPDTATQLIGAVANLGRIVEIEELQRELAELRHMIEDSRR